MTDIQISADYTDERSEWDRRMYEATGMLWCNLADQSAQSLRASIERIAKAYAAEVLAAQTVAVPLVELSTLAAAEAKAVGAVPEGWKLVPMEATEEMIQASYDIANADGDLQLPANAYTTMLAAAPVPPSSPALPEQGWISVDHKLPQCNTKADSLGVEVLIHPPVNGERVAFFSRRCSKDSQFYKYGSVLHGVDYWQPIPTPPAAKEQEKQNG